MALSFEMVLLICITLVILALIASCTFVFYSKNNYSFEYYLREVRKMKEQYDQLFSLFESLKKK